MANYTTAENKRRYKYHAILQESCSNGKRAYAYGDTLTELRSDINRAYNNTRWHKTADEPVINIYTHRTSEHPYGKYIAQVSVYGRTGKIRQLVWEPNDTKKNWNEYRVIERDGTLGPMIKTILQNHHYKR